MHVYSADDNRLRAFGTIAVLAVVASVALNATYEQLGLGPNWLYSAPTLAGAFGVIYAAFDRVLWRWRPVRVLGLVDVPIIDGEYEGELVSSYNATRLPVRIRVDQTWTRMSVNFEVLAPRSSSSYSVTAALVRKGHRDARLTYSYRNQSRPGIAEADMNDHDGTAEVVIAARSGHLGGRYYNYRGRQGTLELDRRV